MKKGVMISMSADFNQILAQTASAKAQMAFQERMSNTAHQREVADLKAAGLNPVLSAGGSGASTPDGASGDASSVLGILAETMSASMQNTAKAVSGLSRSTQSAIKALQDGLKSGSAVAEYERSRQDKFEDQDNQAILGMKLFGIPVGSIVGAIAKAKGYDSAEEFLVDRFGQTSDNFDYYRDWLRAAFTGDSPSAKLRLGLEKAKDYSSKGVSKKFSHHGKF